MNTLEIKQSKYGFECPVVIHIFPRAKVTSNIDVHFNFLHHLLIYFVLSVSFENKK